ASRAGSKAGIPFETSLTPGLLVAAATVSAAAQSGPVELKSPTFAARVQSLLMLWTAPPPARERHGNGAVEAPTIRRSQACRRSQQLVSISRSQSFRFTALMRLGKWWSVGS